MKCPYCQSECEKGIVRSKYLKSFTTLMTETIWYPEDQDGKIFKDGIHSLSPKTEGYYCDNCRKVFAEYEVIPRIETKEETQNL